MTTTAIIPSAGFGERMGADKPKQFLLIGNELILSHTLRQFENASSIDNVVLVVPSKELEASKKMAIHFPKVSDVVIGGKKRQDSVYNGFSTIPPSTEIVVVHDGVRPFVAPAHINESVETARRFGAAIIAVPLNDTVKRVENGSISDTEDRSSLWGAQTPQAFQYTVIRDAFEAAQKHDFYGTDDASLVEQLEVPIKVIMGSRLNIKITTPEDLKLAEAIYSVKG